LTLATVIFAAVIWTAMGIGAERRAGLPNLAALGLVVLIVLQIAAGGFVAGLDAGQGYNTWPLIDGSFIPNGLLAMAPAWRNFFENALTVQFDHRMLAYAIVIYAALLALVSPLPSARLVLVALLLQAALGVWTLLEKAPLSLGLAHQAGAMAVLAAALWHMHKGVSQSPVRDRR
jgi:cytochrome c oxidase assembly protein subunit 15